MKRHRIAMLLGEDRIFATLHEALDVIRRNGAQLDPTGSRSDDL
jgi:hypothetical protein